MIVVVTTEARFVCSPDGRVWSQVGFAHPFWLRYLDVFDGVRVVARVGEVASPPDNHLQVDGPGVTVTAVPSYLGPWQYLCHSRQVRRAVQDSVGAEDAVILRAPSHLAAGLFPALRVGRPYAVEVVGDPWDVFAPRGVQHPLRPFFRWYFTRCLKRLCAHARAAAYVTDRYLQQRYPVGRSLRDGPSNPASRDKPEGMEAPLSMAISDVVLPARDATAGTRRESGRAGVLKLILVGSLAQLYKGPDVALHALAACVQGGLNLELTILGDGKFRPEMERLAARLGVGARVHFRGQVASPQQVAAALDESDLFILPSRTEGLPRALLEAMSRGLPCVASTVGGIPELLPPEDLVQPGDASSLAEKIRTVVADAVRMRAMSERNLRRALDFREEILHERRVAFYRFVRGQTERWIQEGQLCECSMS